MNKLYCEQIITNDQKGIGHIEKEMAAYPIFDKLRLMREKISNLSIVKCRMAHERVVLNADNGLPVSCRFSKSSYQRVGLCTPEVRGARLGCSHSSARIQLDDAINLLYMACEETSASGSLLRLELAGLNNAIHLLDHRKGEAEKQLARIIEESPGGGKSETESEKLREAENEIFKMEQLHDDYVERIGKLRDRVILEIDWLLSDKASTSR